MRYAVFVLMSFICVSCFEPDTTLAPEDYQYIDSLYNENASDIRHEVDSICGVRRDSMFNTMVDSIKQDYIKEIEQIIK